MRSLLCAAWLLAGCDLITVIPAGFQKAEAGPEAGPPAQDAAVSQDAHNPAGDAGQPILDGSVGADAGSPVVDSGTSSPDAGPAPAQGCDLADPDLEMCFLFNGSWADGSAKERTPGGLGDDEFRQTFANGRLGQSNQALSFDGGGAMSIALGDDEVFTNAFTLTTWVKVLSAQGRVSLFTAALEDEPGESCINASCNPLRLAVEPDGVLELTLEANDSSTNQVSIATESVLPMGSYVHVAVRRDPAAAWPTRIYVDGNLISIDNTRLGALDSRGERDVVLGGVFGAGGVEENLTGSVDEFKVWSRSLSDQRLAFEARRWVDDFANGLVEGWDCSGSTPTIGDGRLVFANEHAAMTCTKPYLEAAQKIHSLRWKMRPHNDSRGTPSIVLRDDRDAALVTLSFSHNGSGLWNLRAATDAGDGIILCTGAGADTEYDVQIVWNWAENQMYFDLAAIEENCLAVEGVQLPLSAQATGFAKFEVVNPQVSAMRIDDVDLRFEP